MISIRAVLPLLSGTILGASLTLAGCSTVTSVDLTQAGPKQSDGSYLNYNVAKSQLTIQVTAAANGQAPAISSPGASNTSTTTPAAAAPTSWTISGTVVASGASSGDSSKAAMPTDASRCTVLTAEYNAAQTQVTTEIVANANLLSRLGLLAAGASKDTPKQLAADLKTYATLVESASYVQLIDANAPKAVTKSEADGIYDRIVRDCPPKVNVTVQQSIIPDLKRTYALVPNTNILYSDALTFGVDANGFLTNGAPTSTSQITAITSAVANDVGLFTAPALGAPAEVAPAMPDVHHHGAPPAPVAPAQTTCSAVTGQSADQEVADLAVCDPSKPADVTNAAAIARLLMLDLPSPRYLPNPPSALLPQTIYATLDDWTAEGKLAAGGLEHDALVALHDNFRLDLTLNCSHRTVDGKDVVPADGNPENLRESQNPAAGAYDGIIVSASRPCGLEAKQLRPPPTGSGADASIMVSKSFFLAQDSRFLRILPTQRGFLVARSVGYTFSGGQPTGVVDSRPSEALAIVSFPGQVIGSFFSGMSSAFTNSQARLSGKTGDLNAQLNYLAAKFNLLQEQQKLQNFNNITPTPAN